MKQRREWRQTDRQADWTIYGGREARVMAVTAATFDLQSQVASDRHVCGVHRP